MNLNLISTVPQMSFPSQNKLEWMPAKWCTLCTWWTRWIWPRWSFAEPVAKILRIMHFTCTITIWTKGLVATHLSRSDSVVSADWDEYHVVDLRDKERWIVDVAFQNHLRKKTHISHIISLVCSFYFSWKKGSHKCTKTTSFKLVIVIPSWVIDWDTVLT